MGAGTLPDCAPSLRCLRWSRSRQSAACHRCSDPAGALLLPRRLSRSALADSTIHSPPRWELVLSQLALCSAPPLGAHLTLLQPYASRRRHRYCRRCRWTLIKPPQPGLPLATRTSGKHASTPHAVASVAEAASLSIAGHGLAALVSLHSCYLLLQPYARRRRCYCRRCRWSLIKPPQPGQHLATRTSRKHAAQNALVLPRGRGSGMSGEGACSS
jgi:hypothetical protein